MQKTNGRLPNSQTPLFHRERSQWPRRAGLGAVCSFHCEDNVSSFHVPVIDTHVCIHRHADGEVRDQNDAQYMILLCP